MDNKGGRNQFFTNIKNILTEARPLILVFILNPKFLKHNNTEYKIQQVELHQRRRYKDEE